MSLARTANGFGAELPAGGTFLNGLTNFQTTSLSGVTSKTIPAHRVNQGVAVGKALCARNEPRKELRFVRRGVAPESGIGTERRMLAADISAGFVGRRIKLVDRGVFVRLAAGTVIEHQQMAFAGKPFRDPLDVMLEEETLIEPGPVAIDPGIAPAIKEIAAFAPTPAGMSPGFLGGGAVIDDPDLAELRAAENDLVQVSVIGHRVDVHPVRIDGRTFLFLLRRVLGLAFVASAFAGTGCAAGSSSP